MRRRIWRRLKRLDAGFLIVVAICFIAIWPFLSHSGLPRQTDAELHVFRLAELSRLVRGGELYPRWAPNFYFGYGYPIFNYYAPLAYYLGLPLELLPGLGAVFAVKSVFALSLIAGGVGLYGFVRDRWGRAAGYVAAAAYVYAPYVQYVDPHARGDLAETLSFGLFPLALWAVGRLQLDGRSRSWLAAVALTGAVILSHNLMAMVFFALLLFWVVWQALLATRRRQKDDTGDDPSRRRVVLLFAALGLAVSLTAFFWIPVALEQDVVNLSRVIGAGGHFDFRNHFLGLGELFGPSKWLDWGATEPAFRLNLGLAQWLLGLLGAGAVVVGRARRRAEGLFFVIAAVGLVFMMTSASVPVWEALPLLPFLQFPWRLLGAAAAMLAILAGIGTGAMMHLLWTREAKNSTATNEAEAMTHRRLATLRRWLPALLVAYVLLLALPLAMVPPWPGQGWDTSAQAVFSIERQGRWLGTTSTGDFVPVTVDAVPDPVEPISRSFREGEPPARVNEAALPGGVSVQSSQLSPLHFRYRTLAPSDFLLRLFLFHFPGWQARVDGNVVETELGRPEGFVVIPVPAGEHVVEVEFVETPERRLAWLVSAGGLLLALIVAGWMARRRRSGATKLATALRVGHGRAVLLATVAVFSLLLLAQGLGLFYFRSSGMTAIPAERDVQANFSGQVALIGYDAPAVATSGETIEVALYWKALRQMDINFQVFVHLLQSDGTLVGQSDKLNPGGFPTRMWPLDKYVRDVHELSLPDDLAPGTYRLSTGMWVQSEGWRLPLLDEDEQQIGDNFVFARLQVR